MKKENYPIAIRIPRELKSKIEEEAKTTERSRLAVIRFAIRKYFERDRK